MREKIIQEITETLREKISGEMLTVIQDALVIRLNKYEIQERCTELAEVDTTAEKYLKKFIATKRIEGIAESTLKRYFDMAQKAIEFLKKPLQEVTTYDLRFYLSMCRQKNHVSNRTLDGMRRCLSSFFGWLSAEGLIGRNPCAALSQIKYKKTVKNRFPRRIWKSFGKHVRVYVILLWLISYILPDAEYQRYQSWIFLI